MTPPPPAGTACPPPVGSRSGPSRPLFAAIALTAGFAAILLAMRFVNPVTAPGFPRCLFHALTGYDCPGCGTGRALHALASGRLWLALRCNPLLFACLPLLFSLVAAPRWWNRRTRLVKVFAPIFVAWWIVRNLFPVFAIPVT